MDVQLLTPDQIANGLAGRWQGDGDVDYAAASAPYVRFYWDGRKLVPSGGLGYAMRQSNVMVQRTISMPEMAEAGSGFTFQEVFEVPAFGRVQVRAGYANDTETAFDLTQFGAAPGRAYADLSPFTAAGVAATWATHLSSVNVPVGSATFSTDGILGLAWTPWLTVDLETRTDGVADSSVLVLRSRFGANARANVGNSTRPINLYQSEARLRSRSDYQSGDFITSGQSTFAPGANTNTFYRPISSVEVRGGHWANTIAVCGDSTTVGFISGTASNQYSWVDRACENLAAAGRHATAVKWAAEGKDQTFYMGMATTFLNDATGSLPQVLIIQPFSQNTAGGYTDANVRAAWSLTVALVSLCIAKGVTPMLRTMQPTTSVANSAQEAARSWINTQVRNSGMPVFDIDEVLSDKAAIARILPSLTSDGSHFLPAGQAAASQRLMVDMAHFGLFSRI